MSREAVEPPRRGDIWMVDFGMPIGREQGYRRPAVIVSADQMNRSRVGLVIVVPMTRTRRGLSSQIEVEPGESGLRDVSYAKCEDVKSVSIERLVHRLGRAPGPDLSRIVSAIRYLLDA